MPAEVARSFHEATKHSPIALRNWARRPFPEGFRPMDFDNRPHPFKVYERLERVPLVAPEKAETMSALEAMATTSVSEEGQSLDLYALARLLIYGAGALRKKALSRHSFYFRTYASAGALYPVEIYLVCADLPSLGAGVYHFDPASPALVRLRDGDLRGFLEVATAKETHVGAAPATLILTGIPWRTTWKYTERGYRHLFWDAGMILTNLFALAASSHLSARLVMGFVDADVEHLLGLDGKSEFPLCLLPIGVGEPPGQVGVAAPISPATRPISRREYQFASITEVNNAGRLDSAEEVSEWRTDNPTLTDSSTEEQDGRAHDGPSDRVEAVIRRRGSARLFGPGPVPAEVLDDILDRATRGIPADYSSTSRATEPYLIANTVEGLEPGAFVHKHGFQLLKEGDLRREAGFLCLDQPLGADAAATHFLMTDLDRLLDTFGDRGYRVAQLEAGIVAGKIYLGSYAHGFGASGLTFFDDEVTDFFSPDADGKACMLVVAVGESPRLRRRS